MRRRRAASLATLEFTSSIVCWVLSRFGPGEALPLLTLPEILGIGAGLARGSPSAVLAVLLLAILFKAPNGCHPAKTA
jgi:hypothetical protein